MCELRVREPEGRGQRRIFFFFLFSTCPSMPHSLPRRGRGLSRWPHAKCAFRPLPSCAPPPSPSSSPPSPSPSSRQRRASRRRRVRGSRSLLPLEPPEPACPLTAHQTDRDCSSLWPRHLRQRRRPIPPALVTVFCPLKRRCWCPPGRSGGSPWPALQRSTTFRVATTSTVVNVVTSPLLRSPSMATAEVRNKHVRATVAIGAQTVFEPNDSNWLWGSGDCCGCCGCCLAVLAVVAAVAAVAVVVVVVVVVGHRLRCAMCMATKYNNAARVTDTNWWQVTWESRLLATSPPPSPR